MQNWLINFWKTHKIDRFRSVKHLWSVLISMALWSTKTNRRKQCGIRSTSQVYSITNETQLNRPNLMVGFKVIIGFIPALHLSGKIDRTKSTDLFWMQSISRLFIGKSGRLCALSVGILGEGMVKVVGYTLWLKTHDFHVNLNIIFTMW